MFFLTTNFLSLQLMCLPWYKLFSFLIVFTLATSSEFSRITSSLSKTICFCLKLYSKFRISSRHCFLLTSNLIQFFSFSSISLSTKYFLYLRVASVWATARSWCRILEYFGRLSSFRHKVLNSVDNFMLWSFLQMPSYFRMISLNLSRMEFNNWPYDIGLLLLVNMFQHTRCHLQYLKYLHI